MLSRLCLLHETAGALLTVLQSVPSGILGAPLSAAASPHKVLQRKRGQAKEARLWHDAVIILGLALAPSSLLLGSCLDFQGRCSRNPASLLGLNAGPRLPLSTPGYQFSAPPESKASRLLPQEAHLLAQCFHAPGPRQVMMEKASATRREKRPRYSRPSRPS